MGYLFCREMRQPKCLFFVLLIWCLGTVHGQGCSISAQDSQRSCLKPKLDRGYFDSDEGTYPHGTELYYACDKGWKPVADGWWGMVKCENRKWSHIPQCIDENSCIPPDNPNAKEKPQNVNGWYPNGERVRFDCDSTHEIKGSTLAKCENGSWTELPLCVEKDNVCGKPPPVVTHAVIIHKYQDKFPEDTTINYKCQDSYTLEGTDSTVCLSGGWTKGPTCILTPSPTEWPSTGEGGSSTSSDRGNGGTSSGGDHSTSSGGDHSTSSGGDHSTSSGDEASSNVRPSARPQPSGPFLPVDRCGEKPTVDNGDFISDSDRNQMALTFKCINYYQLVGPEQVMCHSDQTWSKLPICKAPCTIDQRTFYLLDLKKDMFVKEGESQTFLCKKTDTWRQPFVADVRCLNGDVTTDSCTLGCKLDARSYYWLDLIQDLFLKDGRQTLNCKQKDYWGRPLVADVQCQNGYLTSSGCYQPN